MNFNAVNPYSAAAEKAAAAQRAADVRKKLMKSPTDIEGISSPDEAYMVSHWMDPKQRPPHDDVEYHTSSAGKDSDFG
jgi:hypothetical protein